MNNFFILIAVVGLIVAILGAIYVYNEVKDQINEADDIIDRFKDKK